MGKEEKETLEIVVDWFGGLVIKMLVGLSIFVLLGLLVDPAPKEEAPSAFFHTGEGIGGKIVVWAVKQNVEVRDGFLVRKAHYIQDGQPLGLAVSWWGRWVLIEGLTIKD